jgi:signal transduction histidine kinase/ActR/RegA family two-component response regulator
MSPESSMRGVIVTDRENKVRFTDSKICDLLGVKSEELVGRDTVELASETLGRQFSNPEEFERRAVWLTEHPEATSEHVFELATPFKRILYLYSTPLLDNELQAVARVEVYSDITKRRELEDANASLYKQVCSAFEELKAAQHQLVQSEKLRAIGEIASGVAHDFNNTLGIILGNIQLLMRGTTDEKVQRRLKAIEQATLDSKETVRRIREFTLQQPEEPLQPVDLSALVGSVVDMTQGGWTASMQARGLDLEVKCDLGQGVFCLGIAAEIREVLTNILLNSIQAMPGGGSISISTSCSEGTAYLEVVDSGVGMAQAVADRVFDPFFTTKGVEGTGLGMSVAYGIVKRHHGQISVESRQGEGTTVTVSLPTVDESPEIELAERSAGASPGRSARILIVDDEPGFVEVFADMLVEHGHEVCVAGSGEQAVARFASEHFDLVFTDLGMPGMSGWQVAKSIKALRPSVPIVLLTGWGAEIDQACLADAQVDLVLSKPVDLETLSDVITKALASPECVTSDE